MAGVENYKDLNMHDYELIRNDLTYVDSLATGQKRDVSFKTENSTHTRVRDYDLHTGVVYLDGMEYFDYFYDGVVLGNNYGSYVVARNITPWFNLYPGNLRELLEDYSNTFIRSDFETLPAHSRDFSHELAGLCIPK